MLQTNRLNAIVESHSDENILQLPLGNGNFQSPDIISHSDVVDKEREQMETEISPKHSTSKPRWFVDMGFVQKIETRKQVKQAIENVLPQIAIAKKSTHLTGKVVKAKRGKLEEKRKSPFKYTCTKWTGLVLKKSREDTM